MAIYPAAWLDERHRRHMSALDVLVKLGGIDKMVGAHRRVSHNLRLVLEAIAYVAVGIARWAHLPIVKLIFIVQVVVPLVVVALPRDIVLQQDISDATLRGRWNRERCVVGICVFIAVGPISEVARVIMVWPIIVARLTVRNARGVQATPRIASRACARWRRSGASAIGPATVKAGRLATAPKLAVAVM